MPTLPERFGPLHPLARAWAARLIERHAVDLEGGDTAGEPVPAPPLALETIVLRPRNARAAPLTIELTPFPGIRVRAGRWHAVAFPACGCEDCGETFEGEAARLNATIQAVAAGEFAEAIQWCDGAAWLVARLGSGNHISTTRHRLAPADAERLLNGWSSPAVEWSPWPGPKAVGP